ncbi:MAG: helix-turn-helix transcriptional regulator [Proteobacteria bacterium]|nr:helix-turn-helix transcriptional regulator [Pseudomonadota bacterium]
MKRLTVSSADLVVLSLLAEEPMHGYRIVAELDKRDAKDWAEISRPQVYYSLKKLSKLRFISTATDSDEPQGPERDMFRINKSGMQAMNDALCQNAWAEQRPPPPFLTWMALSSHLSSSSTKKIIEARQEYLLKELDREVKTLEAFGEVSDKMITAGRLMVSLTAEHFRTELKWLEKVLRELPKTRT